jgi:phage-related protein (TIGR01555 family)
MGVQGATKAFAQDMFTNAAARMGFGTPSLGQGAEYTLVRISYDYWQLVTLFRNHWISRRIVEVPAQDMVKAWPRLTSDLEPKDLTRVDRALRKTNTKNNVLTGLTWGRLFGGAGGLMVIDGQENELDRPLDLDSIKIGAYKGLIPFDRWAGITPVGDVCTDINRPLDFNKPETYEVRVAGGASFKVHSSRLLRFLGPTVPTPEVEAQSWWGISVLEPTYESITMLDNMGWNILSLTFRANLLGMKFPELAQLLSGLGSSQAASQKFEQRMSALNQLMSINSLIPLPADGSIESTQFSFGGLGEIFQLFQLNLAGAAQMPVTRLFGRTYNGLGQAGDGDERIYEEKIATDQATYLAPQLEKLYPVVCMSELGEVPDDLDLTFPSIRVLDEKEKAELAKSVADTTAVYLNGGIMSPRVVAREVKQSSDITGIGTNLTDEDIEKLADTVQSEGELGEGLFGGEGAGLNEASSPAKAIKLENKEGEQEGQDPGRPGTEQKEPKTPAQNDEPKKETLAKAGEAKDVAPAMDALPEGLSLGESLLVGGRLLRVAAIGDAVDDLEGRKAVPVRFTDGSIVAYAPHGSLAPAQKAFYDGYDEGFAARAADHAYRTRDGKYAAAVVKTDAAYDAIHAQVKDLLARDEAEFKEADHPRAANGQFGSGNAARAHATTSASLRTVSQRADFIKQDLGVSAFEAHRYAASVTKYSSASGYRAVRSGADKIAAAALDDYIAEAPKWDGNGPVYRGLSLPAASVAGLVNGATIDMNGVSSWSSRPSAADAYAERSVSFWEKKDKRRVVLQMDKADSGVSIKHLSDFENEDEVLLASTTRYEVVDTAKQRKRRSDGTTYNVTVVRVKEVVA